MTLNNRKAPSHFPAWLPTLLIMAALILPPASSPAQTMAGDASTTSAGLAVSRPAPVAAPAPTQLSHQQFVYQHFYYNYSTLRLLPQYYEEIFAFHGRLPAKRWLDFYNEQLTPHEGAFYHFYEFVNQPDYTLNDLVTTGSLFGMATTDAATVDFGAERAQVYGRLGLMFGDIYLTRGDLDRALSCYGLVVKMTKIEPESPLLIHLISLQLRQLAYNHMAMALDPYAGATAGSVSQGVRATLDQFRINLAGLRPIEEQHQFHSLLRGEARDLWETLNTYDPPAQPMPGGTPREIWTAVLERWQPVWESGRAPDELQVVSGTRKFATLQALRAEIDQLPDNALFVRDFTAATRRDILFTRITLTQTFWKLLYLEALAIAEPRTAGQFTEIKKVIPADLYPYMLLDPFTGLIFGTLTKQPGARANYYSFGPDRDDDAAKINYDPERGLISDGDIPLFY